MRSQPEIQLAFVLHSRPFKENQAILELLVAGQGRLSAITFKGSKKNTAKTALLQPFRPLKVLVEKDAGLRKLKHIEAAEEVSAEAMLSAGKPLFCGFYLNEIVCRLCAADAHFPDMFGLYLSTVSTLNSLPKDSGSAELEQALRRFEYSLLAQLGYGIDLQSTADTSEAIQPDLKYELQQDIGFVFGAYTRNAWEGADILNVARFLQEQPMSEQEFKRAASAAKLLLRTCLHRHLGDKPLKSRELFRAG